MKTKLVFGLSKKLRLNSLEDYLVCKVDSLEDYLVLVCKVGVVH
jgi:hypothetical protein